MEASETDESRDARMGRAIVKGILVATPIALIGLGFGIALMTGRGLSHAFSTAILPGILMGGFFGGFYGLVRTME